MLVFNSAPGLSSVLRLQSSPVFPQQVANNTSQQFVNAGKKIQSELQVNVGVRSSGELGSACPWRRSQRLRGQPGAPAVSSGGQDAPPDDVRSPADGAAGLCALLVRRLALGVAHLCVRDVPVILTVRF